MKKFKLLSMSFILSILAIVGSIGGSHAEEYKINDGYFGDTTEVIVDNRGDTTIDANNNYGYGVMFVGPGITLSEPAELKKHNITLKCYKQLNGYFTINFTNFLMLPLNSEIITQIGSLLYGDVSFNTGGLFYDCRKKSTNEKYEGVYGYIEWTYGENTHRIIAGLDSTNQRMNISPLQISYSDDYPNTYRTLSGNIYDSLIGGNVKITPKSLGIVGIENYQNIGGTINNPIYYISNNTGMKIYTKFSKANEVGKIRLMLTGYDTNGQATTITPLANNSIIGNILSGTDNSHIRYSNGNNVTTKAVNTTNKEFGLYGYDPITYEKIGNLASGTIKMEIGTGWTQQITFMVSGVNCEPVVVTPEGCYNGDKTATITCITGNIHKTNGYNRDNQGRTTSNSFTLSGNGEHTVLVQDWLGNTKEYTFQVSGINNTELQAPTNLSVIPATGNDRTPTFNWNAPNDESCNNGLTIYYQIRVFRIGIANQIALYDNITGTSYTPTENLPTYNPGQKYEWQIRARHTNDWSPQATGTFYIDVNAPTITITNPSSTTCAASKTISGSATDAGAGLNSFEWTISQNGTCNSSITNFNSYTGPITLDQSYSGKYICFRATDKAGNTGYKISNIITKIDTTGPTGSITPTDGVMSGTIMWFSGGNIKFQLSAQDVGCSTVSKMQFSCNNGANWTTPVTYNSSYSQPLTSYGCTATEGEKTISVRFIDSLNNTGQSYSANIKIDTTAPECVITQETDCQLGYQTIYVNATDAGIGVASITPDTHYLTHPDNRSSTIKDYLGNSRICSGTVSSITPQSTVNTTIRGIPTGRTGNDITVTFERQISNSCEGGSNNNLEIDTYYCIYNSGGNCNSFTELPGTDLNLNISCEQGQECRKYIKYYSSGAGILPETTKTSDVILIDHKKPTCSYTYIPNPEHVQCISGSITGYIYAEDTGAGLSTATTSPKIYTFTENGERSYTFRDNVGNSDTCTLVVNSIDKSGGVGTIELKNGTTSGNNKIYYSGLNITLKLSVTNDPGCSQVNRMIFSCDGTNWSNPVTYSTGYSRSPYYTFKLQEYTNYGCSTSDGQKTIHVKYIDTIGNTGSDNTVTLYLDRTAPACNTGAIIYTPSSCTSGTVSANVSSAANDTGIGLQSISPTTPISFTGNTTKYYTVKDYLGNAGQCPATVNRINHGTATGSITAVGGVNIDGFEQAFSGNITLELSATSAGCSSEVDQMQFSCNGTNRSTKETYSTTKSFNLSTYKNYGCNTGVGTKTIRVQYLANNTPQRSGSTEIYFDNVAPNDCQIDYNPDSDVICTQNNVQATLYTDDIGVGLSDDIIIPHTLTFTNSGTQSVTFKDKVGNSKTCTANVNWINPNPQTKTGHINVQGGVNVTGKGKSFSGLNLTLQLDASSDGGCSNSVTSMQFKCSGTNRSTAEPFSTTKSFNLGSYTNYGCTTADGNKTIQVKYSFSDGSTITASTGIFLDTTKPTCNTPTYNPPENNGCTNGPVTATLSANDNGVGLSGSNSQTHQFTTNTGRSYTFKDKVGNSINCEANVNWILSDNDTVNTEILGAPTDWTGKNVSVSFSVNTNSACNSNSNISTTTKYCIYNSGSTPCTRWKTWTGTNVSITCSSNQVCNKRIRYYSQIIGGSSEAIRETLIKIDKQKPKCNTTTYNPDTCTNANVTAELKAQDTGAGLSTATTSPQFLTFTTNTTSTYNFKDKVGNNRDCTGTVSWIDRNAPIGTIGLTGGRLVNNIYYYSGTTIHLQLSATDEGCSAGSGMKMQFSCDGINRCTKENYSTSKDLILKNYKTCGKCTTTDGNKNIYVRFFDYVGNTGTAVFTGFSLDTTKPQCGNVTFSTQTCTNTDVTAKLYAQDTGGLDSSTPSPATLKFTDNGTKSYTFKDIAGNSKQCNVTVDWIDKNAPSPIIFEDETTQECVGVDRKAMAEDHGCAGIDLATAFNFNRETFGNGSWGPSILRINDDNENLKRPIEKILQGLTVRDNIGNQITVKAFLNVKDTLPTLGNSQLSYNDENTPISGDTLLYEDLIEAMRAVDGACGPKTIKIESIKCSEGDFRQERNGILVTPPRESVGTISCKIIFIDDEGNDVAGTLNYYYDTLKPTCSWSNPNPQCIPGGGEGTINLTCSDKNGKVLTDSLIMKKISYNSNVLTLNTVGIITPGWSNGYTYKLKYTGKSINTGETELTLSANSIFDLAFNSNERTISKTIQVDNAGPTFTVTMPKDLYECNTGTLKVSKVTQIGCAGTHRTPYSWNGGISYGANNTYSVYNGTIGTKSVTIRVRDEFGNYTEQTKKITWNDAPLKIEKNKITVPETCGSKTINWKELSITSAGSCEIITAKIIEDGKIGKCKLTNIVPRAEGSGKVEGIARTGNTFPTIEPGFITYTPNDNVEGNDTCILEVTDGDTKGYITITREGIDTVSPKITLESDATDGCRKGGKFTVTGTWNESTKGFEIKDINAKIGKVGERFTFEKLNTYAWLVSSPTDGYGDTSVRVNEGAVTDLCENKNKESKPIRWQYDNEGPDFDVDIKPGYECEKIIATITDVNEIGCAKSNEKPYSRDGGEYTSENTYIRGRDGTGEERISVRVQDALGNYTEQFVTFVWQDFELTADDSIEKRNVGNQIITLNRLKESNAQAGSCDTITATINTNGNKGRCEINPNNSNELIYTPNANVVGEDTCILNLTDGETTLQVNVYFYDIDTKHPNITINNNKTTENTALKISMKIVDEGTGLKEYKCGDNERQQSIEGTTNYYCDLGTQPEPTSGSITIQARDKRGNANTIKTNYEWTNVTPTANNISNQSNEANPIPLTANATDPGGTTFRYQWYSDATCYTKINNETSLIYTAAAQPEPITKQYYYKATDAQGLESNCASAEAIWNNVAPTAYDVSATANEGQPITLKANGTDPGGTTSTGYQWYSDATCRTKIYNATNLTYTIAAEPEPTTKKYYYKITDRQGKASNCATGTATRKNVKPTGEISNDGPKPECTNLTYNMTGHDAGGGKLTYTLYEGSTCKGTIVRSGINIESGTPKTRAHRLRGKGTYQVSLQIKDNNKATSNCVSTIGTWEDTIPTFKKESKVNIGNITGTHLTTPFVTEDLIRLMQPIDGDCGSDPMKLVSVKCDEKFISKATVEENKVILIPNENIESESSCQVEFTDDEGNVLYGIISFYIDTVYPTITINSQWEKTCQRGGTELNVEGRRNEKDNKPVLGFDKNDIKINNGNIGNFINEQNPIFVWYVISPSTNGAFGTTSIIVQENAATDQLGNPNQKPSNEIFWEYDNAGPKITFKNHTTPECVATTRKAEVEDIGCAGIKENAFLFGKAFGNGKRSDGTLNISAGQVTTIGKQIQELIVKDSLGNQSSATATLTIEDTKPTFKKESKVNIGNITGTHLTTPFVTEDLIKLMQPIDGACGSVPMKLISVKCDDRLIRATVEENKVILIPNENIESESSCQVDFTDDEGNVLNGIISFYIDTKNPTIEISSNGVNSCQKGGQARNVTGTRNEKVLGFESKDIIINNGNIEKFTDKNPIYTRNAISPNRIGTFGTTSIIIKEYAATDQLGNPNQKPSNEISWNYDNACPQITFNNISTNECTSVTWTVSAEDKGCAGLENTAYKFSSTNFGNDKWGNNTLTITAAQVPNAITQTKSQTVTVKDKLGNSCDATANLTINNVTPTIGNNNYSIGTLTGTNINNRFSSTNLVNAMNVIDGPCGTGTITLKSVSNCTTSLISDSKTGANNIIQLKAKPQVEGNGTCTVTFADDEGTTVNGTIKFYVDSKNPTVTLTSNGTNSCQKATTYTVTGTFSEAVTGVEQSDLVVTNGSIQSFNNKTNNITVRTVKSNNTGHGWLSITIPANKFTDLRYNPNAQPSLGASGWYYDNAAPNQPNINYKDSDKCLSNNAVNIVANTVRDNGCNNNVQYQFCKSTTNTINDCDNQNNLTTRTNRNTNTFKNLNKNTTYYFFVRAKDGLGNTTNWSPAYGTIESLSAQDFIGYFNAKKGEDGPFTVTANRKRKSYASAGICDDITATIKSCTGGIGSIEGDILKFTSNASNWSQLHDQTQRGDLYCELLINDKDTEIEIKTTFQIKFDEIYLEPIVITGVSFVDYNGQIQIGGGRTYKYTNNEGITLQINGGFISKDPENHRYKVSCDGKNWPEDRKRYPNDKQGGIFDRNLIKGIEGIEIGCNENEGNRQVYVKLCDAPAETLCKKHEQEQ